jgi:hypothetical protein
MAAMHFAEVDMPCSTESRHSLPVLGRMVAAQHGEGGLLLPKAGDSMTLVLSRHYLRSFNSFPSTLSLAIVLEHPAATISVD